MYIQELISIGKAENGYAISVRVPMKKETSEPCCAEDEKVYLVSDENALTAKLTAILPTLVTDDPEKEMQEAFKEAINE